MADTQNHIHLALTVGGSPEFAPIYKWKTIDREDIVVFDAEVVVSLQGYPYAHVIERAGDPVIRYDFQYKVKCIGDNDHDVLYYVDLLKSLAGRELKLVDHFHPADGVSHASYVQNVFMSKLGPFPADHLQLKFFYVPIYLNGMDT